MHPSNAQQAKFASREMPPPVLEDPALSRQSSRTGHESRISTPEGEKKRKERNRESPGPREEEGMDDPPVHLSARHLAAAPRSLPADLARR